MSSLGDKKRRINSAFTAYLTLLGDSRWASKRALYLWLKTPNRRSELIREMQDEGYITCINMNEKAFLTVDLATRRTSGRSWRGCTHFTIPESLRRDGMRKAFALGSIRNRVADGLRNGGPGFRYFLAVAETVAAFSVERRSNSLPRIG